jgi:hypothetical protein
MLDYTWAASLGAGAICLGAGLLGWMKSPKSNAAALFLLAMASIFVGMITRPLYPMIDTANAGAADTIAKAFMICSLLTLTFLWELTIVFPVDRKISFRPINGAALLIIAGVVAAVIVGSMAVIGNINSAHPDLSQGSMRLLALHGGTLVVLATAFIMISRSNASAGGKRSSTIFLIGMWVFVGSGLPWTADTFGRQPVSSDVATTVLVVGVALAGLLFAFSIARGQMVMAMPVQEKMLSSSKAKYKLLHRFVYLVVEPKPDFAFKIFTDVLKGRCTDCANDDSFPCESLDCASCKLPCPCSGCSKYRSRPQGLIVTRQFPHEVRAKHYLQTTPIIWLSTVAGKDNMDPAKLSLLTDYLVNFMENSQNGVILVDGLEYLATSNDFLRLLKSMDRWTETAMTSDSVLIMSVDARSFEPKELALMERNREIVRPDAPESWMIIPERV